MPSRTATLAAGDPLDTLAAFGDQRNWRVPDIIEFVTSDQYLNRTLYPRQATLLKTIFLQDELFSSYDLEVLEKWSEGFHLPILGEGPTAFWEGDYGIVPDVLDRIKTLKDLDYRWFSIVLAAQGRRSGKGYIGSLAYAYILWNFIWTGDPKFHYGIDRDKRISAQVFAGKKAQARDNQWRDIASVLLGAECFQDFIQSSLTAEITIASSYDRVRAREMQSRGIESQLDMASFEIVPKEASTMAARGPASHCQYFDEGAHMSATGVSRSMGEVWDSSTPALRQFGKDSFIYSGSSTWAMIGRFYEKTREALEFSIDSMKAVNPSILLVQLPSWDIYEDWNSAPSIEMSPRRTVHYLNGTSREVGGEGFSPLKRAIMEYDEEAKRIERANPDSFAVEYRSKWATATDAYLPLHHVRRAFGEWRGEPLSQRQRGVWEIDYYAHGDPGRTGSNFGWSIAHLEDPPDDDDGDIPHVVFDKVVAWTQGDFPVHDERTGELIRYDMDYDVIEEAILKDVVDFQIQDTTFDSYNSISLIAHVNARARKNQRPGISYELTPTHALNWEIAETFKMALALDLIHFPQHDLLQAELEFLKLLPGNKVDHPTEGVITTKDVYDSASAVVWKLLGKRLADAYGRQFSDAGVRGAAQVASPSSLGVDGVHAALSSLLGSSGRRSGAPQNRLRGRGARR